jgi:EAL domain-containing protein (putative c-di-GMP-specific phosphodiesterase class I)
MELRAIATGVEYLQGYHISLPLAADAAEVWLRDRSAAGCNPAGPGAGGP